MVYYFRPSLPVSHQCSIHLVVGEGAVPATEPGPVLLLHLLQPIQLPLPGVCHVSGEPGEALDTVLYLLAVVWAGGALLAGGPGVGVLALAGAAHAGAMAGTEAAGQRGPGGAGTSSCYYY